MYLDIEKGYYNSNVDELATFGYDWYSYDELSRINLLEKYFAAVNGSETHFTVGNFIFTYDQYKQQVLSKTAVNNGRPMMGENFVMFACAALTLFTLILGPLFANVTASIRDARLISKLYKKQILRPREIDYI